MPRNAIELLSETERLYLFPEVIKEEEEVVQKEVTEKRDGKKEKVVKEETVTRVTVRTAVNEHVERRKAIVPFIPQAFKPSSEDVVLVFPNQLAQVNEAEVDDEDDSNEEEAEIKRQTLEDIVCSHCGGKGHLSFECKNRDASRKEVVEAPEESDTYLTPAQRAERAGREYQNSFTVRLSNIPDTMTQETIKRLYKSRGGDERTIMRIHFPKDHLTGKQRDTCFIDFSLEQCMLEAIEKLDGILFESMVFRCEKAKPRKN